MQHSILAGYSILVVEDELFIARCLQMVLEAAGAEVHRAPSLREALDIAGQPGLSAKLGLQGQQAHLISGTSTATALRQHSEPVIRTRSCPSSYPREATSSKGTSSLPASLRVHSSSAT